MKYILGKLVLINVESVTASAANYTTQHKNNKEEIAARNSKTIKKKSTNHVLQYALTQEAVLHLGRGAHQAAQSINHPVGFIHFKFSHLL